MWLINVDTGEQEWFDNEDKAPRYAILSHSWALDPSHEVTFQEWRERTSAYIRDKSGFSKIVDFCAKVNKPLSAMLTFPMYLVKALRQSRWFKRGWTLQELIAPQEMIFLAFDWSEIGPRHLLSTTIEEICKVDKDCLTCPDGVRTASIAKRMSWVSNRETSRKEDLAYCLMGIFDVNMPLLYGEGECKAFRRLQEEIIRLYPEDYSIYAWGKISDPSPASSQMRKLWPHKPLAEPLMGLLARSPKGFEGSSKVAPVSWAGRFFRFRLNENTVFEPPAIIGKGIRVCFPARYNKIESLYEWGVPPLSITQTRPGVIAVLLCTADKDRKKLIVLPLISWGDGYFGRTKDLTIADDIELESEDPSTLYNMQQTLYVAEETRIQPRSCDVIIRELEVRQRAKLRLWGWVTNGKANVDQERLIRLEHHSPGNFMAYNFKYRSPLSEGFSIVLGREQQKPGSIAAIHLSVVLRGPPFAGDHKPKTISLPQ